MVKFVLGFSFYTSAFVLAGAVGFVSWSDVLDTVWTWGLGYACGLYVTR